MKKHRFITVALIVIVSLLTFNACSSDDEDATTSISLSEDITITDTNVIGTAEGDTDNTGYDEDDLVENATFEDTV